MLKKTTIIFGVSLCIFSINALANMYDTCKKNNDCVRISNMSNNEVKAVVYSKKGQKMGTLLLDKKQTGYVYIKNK